MDSYSNDACKQMFEHSDELVMALQTALEQEQFQLVYQPKLHLSTGKMVGVEALIRWHHPDKGTIPPATFIPQAEESGLIIPIGEWVLRRACQQNKDWHQQGFGPIVMSVNLSVRQLHHPKLVETVEQCLRETQLDPALLELEITESMLMETKLGVQVLHELKDLGVKISLDDFGTGYSSLYFLKDFPIDKLKIDQSFVRHSSTDDKHATIVRTIIAMAHQLKLEVVAEGIELQDHLIMLQRNLCNEGQGYLFSQPVTASELFHTRAQIEQKVVDLGVETERSNQVWLDAAGKVERQELLDLVRQQQGMIFKYIFTGGKFVHTLCDGELLYKMNLKPEEVIGRELYDFLPRKQAEHKRFFYQRAWDGEQVTYEDHLNGVDYLASLRPILVAGQVVEVVGSLVDITERKKVEEKLRISDTYFRLITDNITDLVGIWDAEGNIMYASPSHEVLLGISPESYKGLKAMEIVHYDDQPRFRIHLQQMRTELKSFQTVLRCQNDQGRWIPIEAKFSPVVDPNGHVEHVIVVGRTMAS